MIKTQRIKSNFFKFIALFKDWRFSYKFASFTIIFIMLLLAFIYGFFIDYWYINPEEDLDIAYPRMYNMFVMLSFWSVHTNILVALWFLYALFYHNNEEKNKFTNSKSQLNITVYISLTFLLFWGWISYPFDDKSMSDYISTFLTHLVTPLLMMIYYPLSNCKKLISYKTFFIKDLAIMFIYPVIYCLYSYMRAQMVTEDGIDKFVYVYSGILDFNTVVIKGTPLWLSNTLCIVILSTLLFGFQIGYVALNNLIYKYKIKKIAHNKSVTKLHKIESK